jgi:hypothetical protein
MNRVIIGSSNVTRFNNKDNFKNYKSYMTVNCTDISCFRATMANLGSNDGFVIISVLENFLDKAGARATEQTEEDYALLLGDTIDGYLRVIEEAAVRHPGSKFSIADPIWRPKLGWYQGMFDEIIITCKESISKMKTTNVSRIDAIPEGCQQFENDQIHLTTNLE